MLQHHLSNFVNQYVPPATALADRAGSIWKKSADSHELIGQLHYWLESQLVSFGQRETQLRALSKSITGSYEIFLPAGWIPFHGRPMRRGNVWVCAIPDWLVTLGTIRVGKEILERGQDFWISDQHLLVKCQTTLSELTGVAGSSIVGQTYVPHRFWANVLGYSDLSPGALEFYQAVLAAGRDGLTAHTLGNLLGAAVGTRLCQQDSVVRQIRPSTEDLPSPVVLTDHEAIGGIPNAEVVVEVGDQVWAGDHVFDSVRTWDCQNAIPDWCTQLKIYPRYLMFAAREPLIVTTTPSPATFIQVGNVIRTRFEISGTDDDVAKFFEAQDAREDKTGFRLVNYLANSSNPGVLNITEDFNWLEVLRSCWLRHGVIVSYLRDELEDIPEIRFRLGMIRRAIPPWITHMVQFDQQANDYC